MTTETNIMEKIVSWPTSSVTTPSDQHRLRASTASIAHEATTRRNASSKSASVRTSARTLAIWPSRVAAISSSPKSAGAPVTPASTAGNCGRRSAIACRTVWIAACSAAKVRGVLARSITT